MLNDITKFALAKGLFAGLPGKDKFQAPVGTVEINQTVTLKIKGQIKKNPPGPFTPTIEIPLKLALAIALEKAGFQREHVKRILVESMTEALAFKAATGDNEEAVEAKAAFLKERLNDIEAAEAHVASITEALPKGTRAGNTYCTLQIEEVEQVA